MGHTAIIIIPRPIGDYMILACPRRTCPNIRLIALIGQDSSNLYSHPGHNGDRRLPSIHVANVRQENVYQVDEMVARILHFLFRRFIEWLLTYCLGRDKLPSKIGEYVHHNPKFGNAEGLESLDWGIPPGTLDDRESEARVALRRKVHTRRARS